MPSTKRFPQLKWALHRQLFFVQQRIFASLSFLLLDNMSSGRLRASLLRLFGARIGQRCFIRGSLQIQESFNFRLGDEVFINAGCCLDGSAPITVADRVQFGFQVTLITGGHDIGPPHTRAGAFRAAPIVIEEGVWIGARATVLPGVTIGAGSVVGAGAVVTRDIPPNTLAVGVPARPLRTLDDASREEILLTAQNPSLAASTAVP